MGVLPVLGAIRRRNTSASSSPSCCNADGEDSESWRYSKHGHCVSALQKPDATNVAGLRTWNSLGRFVKRGEKGIFILAPMVGKRSSKDVATDEPSEDVTTEGQRTLYGFRAVYVFDRLSRDYGRAFTCSMGAAGTTLKSPLDSSKHIIAQVVCSAQRLLMLGFQLSASFARQSRF